MRMKSEANPVITIMGEEEPIEIPFSAVAAFHGQAALAMLAVTFQAIGLALRTLSPDRLPSRNEISVVSGHPGPGVRDSFEFVTRALTRGAYRVDRSLPEARLVAGSDISYSFRVTLNERTVEVALRRSALPERFFSLNFKPSRTSEDEIELSRLKRSIAGDVLAAHPDDLFDIRLYAPR